jgi:pyridoxine kinase
VKAAAPSVRLIVDPIMGDEDSGLYVKAAVAEAVAALLVLRADIVAPNAWELGRLSGAQVASPQSAIDAARRLHRPVLVSSIRRDGDIGALYVEAEAAWLASHAAAPAAPKGAGDLLTALFAAALLGGFTGADALGLAVGGVADAVDEAAGEDELPLAAFPATLAASPFVSLEAIDG